MSKKVLGKKRWSLVRFLASCIPTFLWEYFVPVSPRMHISLDFLHKIPVLKHNNFTSEDTNTSFCSFKQNFHIRNHENILNSTPKRVEDVADDKLRALQEDLDEVKKMIARLMEKQYEQCSDYGTLSSPSDQLQKSLTPPVPPPCPAPPPPPPPPPLPPNFSLIPVNSPLKIEKKTPLVTPQGIQQQGFPCGKELLKDLKKVKLKKIEKSPGGGPLKKAKKSVNDPGDILAAVLKKRYDIIQNSPESSLESDSDSRSSFGSGTTNNRYEVTRNNKLAVV